MFATTLKQDFKTLLGVLVLIMLIGLPAASGARHGGGNRRAEHSFSSSRSEAEFHHSPGISNDDRSERSISNRGSDEPMMKSNTRAPVMQDRSNVSSERSSNNFDDQTSKGMSNRERPKGENSGNIQQTRAKSTTERVTRWDSDNHSSSLSTARFGTTVSPQQSTRFATNLNHKNVNLNVVNNVPAAMMAQRNGVSRDTRGFSHFNRNRERTIDISRNDFAFFGHHHHFIHHRIVRPDFFFFTFFSFGPWDTFCPIYPYYHLGYVFVNPCGYWPYDYSYVRYYWYGCYPYYWYGYNPVPYEYGGNTNNYYTYNNYYGSENAGPANENAAPSTPNYSPPQPAAETPTDKYFDEGVKAFSAGDYSTAVAKFDQAGKMAPEDKVLPFAYSQALLAVGDYKAAAQALRTALAKVNPVDEGVFYPRGLYSSDDILLKQIGTLSKKANQNKQDMDMQLLLGYQQLGLGELDKAAEPLKNASVDLTNGPAANALMQLLDKLQPVQNQVPATQTPTEGK